MVGLVPLFAVETIEPELLEQLPDFMRRLDWFVRARSDLACGCACLEVGPAAGCCLRL